MTGATSWHFDGGIKADNESSFWAGNPQDLNVQLSCYLWKCPREVTPDLEFWRWDASRQNNVGDHSTLLEPRYVPKRSGHLVSVTRLEEVTQSLQVLVFQLVIQLNCPLVSSYGELGQHWAQVRSLETGGDLFKYTISVRWSDFHFDLNWAGSRKSLQ